MKRVLIAFLSLPIIMASCKEKGPTINFSDEVKVDTNYMAPVQVPQSRRVLMEEFTGIRCSNCPEGHLLVSTLERDHPGQIIAVALHMTDNPLTLNHPEISPIDFRTSEATQIDQSIYLGETSLPFAGIDRTPYNNNIVIGRLQWATDVESRLTRAPSVNLSISSSYDSTARVGLVVVAAHYTADVTKKQKLSLMLVEDSIVAPQDYVDSTNGRSDTYSNYIHNHILRKIYTLVAGSTMLDTIATKKAGQVYERTFIVKAEKAWNANHCRLIAFIHNDEADDKEVLQAAETALKP